MESRVVATPDLHPGGRVMGARVTNYVGLEGLSAIVGEDNIITLIADLARILSEMRQARPVPSLDLYRDLPCDTEAL